MGNGRIIITQKAKYGGHVHIDATVVTNSQYNPFTQALATMLQYIESICPYVEGVRSRLSCDSAVVIIDNFKGQVHQQLMICYSHYNIHTCLLSANTTEHLQPLHISVNKPVTDHPRNRFDNWYSQQVMQQLYEKSDEELENLELPAIDLSVARMKEISAE